ncbi:MAG: type II toxin-antitoxin system VapC family toxin [Rhizonema sp. PD37]|nr:type II toxin-antitoxin system VapC family toxin [Rhizonema sp. PD37]
MTGQLERSLVWGNTWNIEKGLQSQAYLETLEQITARAKIEALDRSIETLNIELLEIQAEHLDTLAKLPFYHKDPFDRLIIAQNLVENIPLVTKDGAFTNYSVMLLW